MKNDSKTSQTFITIDVMRFFYNQERFFCTLQYPHLDCFKLDLQDLYDFVIKQKPSLEGEKIKIYLGKGDGGDAESVTIYPYKQKQQKTCHRRRKSLTSTARI